MIRDTQFVLYLIFCPCYRARKHDNNPPLQKRSWGKKFISTDLCIIKNITYNPKYPTIGGQRYSFYIRSSWNWGIKCPIFVIICDVSDSSSCAFCHSFTRWHIILFHIFTIGGILSPQFCTCINTNFSVEEDSLFAWSQMEIFYDSSKLYRTGFCSGLSNSLVLSSEFQIIPNNSSASEEGVLSPLLAWMS